MHRAQHASLLASHELSWPPGLQDSTMQQAPLAGASGHTFDQPELHKFVPITFHIG